MIQRIVHTSVVRMAADKVVSLEAQSATANAVEEPKAGHHIGCVASRALRLSLQHALKPTGRPFNNYTRCESLQVYHFHRVFEDRWKDLENAPVLKYVAQPCTTCVLQE